MATANAHQITILSTGYFIFFLWGGGLERTKTTNQIVTGPCPFRRYQVPWMGSNVPPIIAAVRFIGAISLIPFELFCNHFPLVFPDLAYILTNISLMRGLNLLKHVKSFPRPSRVSPENLTNTNMQACFNIHQKNVLLVFQIFLCLTSRISNLLSDLPSP